MLGSSWSAIQAYILRASESCFLKFVMLGTPSFILLQRMSAESRNKNPWGRHKGERKRKAWTWVLGKKLSFKDVFLK